MFSKLFNMKAKFLKLIFQTVADKIILGISLSRNEDEIIYWVRMGLILEDFALRFNVELE